MFSDSEVFGPDNDNTLEGPLLNNYKDKHNYKDLSKSEEAPWHNFLIKNAIIY